MDNFIDLTSLQYPPVIIMITNTRTKVLHCRQEGRGRGGGFEERGEGL